ncbi:MAG: hypothetical protein Q8J88_06375 [Bacteroidales bacterium]|nr:hypothetical protein [Bacteroidales bacterium]
MSSTKITLTALLLTLVMTTGFSQGTNKLSLTDIKIALNNQAVESLSEVSVDINNDSPVEVILYQDNGITFGTIFETRHSGKRMKLIRRSFVEKQDGKRKYTRKQKNVDLLKVSVPGKISGRYAESILFDASKMNNIAVGYKYELHYK